MEDRELLELAAKAAGIKAILDPVGQWRNCTGAHQSMNVFSFPLWNPLKDDGDALRLAVKLGMNVWCDPAAVCMAEVLKHCLQRQSEPSKTDPYAATRRAIVRAAAEIGKTM